MNRFALPLLAGLLAGTALAGPAFAAKDLVVGLPDNITTLDPADINDTLSQSASRTMLQGLFGFDKDMKLVPLLAESFTVNDTATEYTYRLRKNVTFHDGTPFNAQAVKTNFDRLANPANRLKRQSLLAMLAETVVVDDYTITLKLSQPFGALNNNLAHPGAMIHSPKALETLARRSAAIRSAPAPTSS